MQRRTIARHLREGDIHVDCELLSSALVDNNRRVDIDLTVIEELDHGNREDNRGRN